MLAADVGHLRASLLLLQHRYNLLFSKSLLLHSSVLCGPDSNPIWRKLPVAGQSYPLTFVLRNATLQFR